MTAELDCAACCFGRDFLLWSFLPSASRRIAGWCVMRAHMRDSSRPPVVAVAAAAFVGLSTVKYGTPRGAAANGFFFGSCGTGAGALSSAPSISHRIVKSWVCTAAVSRVAKDEPLPPLPATRRSLAIPRHERKIARKTRSFRRCQAPLTRGQRRTLRELWPKHGLLMDFKSKWNFTEILPTELSSSVILDIGFGCGDSLLGMAAARPEDCFVGIEVHKPGVANALARLEAERLPNVKLIQGDAITVLCDHVEDRSLDECCLFFPDPFPHARDSGRRLVRPLLLALLSAKLRHGGVFNLATDVEEYAAHIEAVMSSVTSLSESSTQGLSAAGEEHMRRGIEWVEPQPAKMERNVTDERVACWTGGETGERPTWRPVTKYEEKAREAGRRVRNFRYRLDLASPVRLPSPVQKSQV